MLLLAAPPDLLSIKASARVFPILSVSSSKRIAAITESNLREDERAVFVIALMSSFPVQSRGIESESWLNNVENLSTIRIKTLPASSFAFVSTTPLA
nr:hypothetical protein Iba_scaffold40179CG0010 [Ipomoea batatas]GMD30482.1 hypothetical protein Iba_chr09aCG7390 [Ipomoea batatas]